MKIRILKKVSICDDQNHGGPREMSARFPLAKAWAV